MTQFQKEELAKLLKLKECQEFCHGDCIGSDEQAADIALGIGVKIFTVFPPTGTTKRAYWMNPEKFLNNDDFQWNYNRDITVRWHPKDEYLKRNQKIVEHCKLMIAAPKEFEHTLRSGTWATIRYAWKIRRDITIIPPVKK
jgi:hypothetical protein